MESIYKILNDTENGLLDGDVDFTHPIDMNSNSIKECNQIDTLSTLKLSVNNTDKITVGSSIDFNNNKVINLANGTADTDGVNKSQLDGKLSLDGTDTMTGDIKLGDNDIIFSQTGDAPFILNDNGDLKISTYKAATTGLKMTLYCDGIGASHEMMVLTGGVSGNVSIKKDIDMNGNSINNCPSIFTPAYFSAQMHANTDDLAPGVINWNDIDLNIGFTHSSGIIQVNTTGIYNISICAAFEVQSSGNKERFCQIDYKEGSTVLRSALGQVEFVESGTNYGNVSTSFVYSLTAGNNYSFEWSTGAGGSGDLDFRTHCSFHRIA